MLHQYQLTNFKAFAGPETIFLKPITLIYGPNSSGKSSLIQSLLLLKQTLQDTESQENLLIPNGNLVNLGNYQEFVHRHNIADPFSFKVLLKVEGQEPGKILADILSENPILGLRIEFGYDELTLNNAFSTIEFFIGEEKEPAFIYKSEVANKAIVKLEKINYEHYFWIEWWKKYKITINYAFLKVIRGFLEDLQKINPLAVEDKITSKTKHQKIKTSLKKAHEYLMNLKQKFENEKTEIEPELLDQLDKIQIINQLMKKNEEYTIEKAVEDFSTVIRSKSCIYNRNFLPIGLREIVEDVDWEIDCLSQIYGDFGTAEYLWSLAEPACFMLQQILEKAIYIGPLRDYPERFYIFSGNSNEQVGKSGKMISDLLYKNPELVKRVNAQFDNFDLGYEIKVSKLVEAESLERSEIFRLRLIDKNTNVSVSLPDVGFGISQVLPIIVQSMFSKNQTILIEQPEIHIHPRLQTQLGSLFAECIKSPFENQFIIETHSEHLILRLRKLIRQGKLKPEDVSVIYVDRNSNGSKCLQIRLDEEGDFIDSWPDGFFEEDFNELFN